MTLNVARQTLTLSQYLVSISTKPKPKYIPWAKVSNPDPPSPTTIANISSLIAAVTVSVSTSRAKLMNAKKADFIATAAMFSGAETSSSP